MHNDYIYVLCSGTNSRVLKLDSDLNPLLITHNDSSEDFGEAYGMLVTSDHVFVASRKYPLLCVLDLNLKYQYNLELSEIPIGIAALDVNKYIVTFEAAIGVIDINFDEKKYRERKFKCVRMENGDDNNFRARYNLRSICVSDQYIFVTEVWKPRWKHAAADGRLLCLKYNERSGLTMVAAQSNFSAICNCSQCCTNNRTESKGKRCNAIVVTSYNGAIYYSQGSYGEMFHIVKATVNETSIDSNKLFDVPSN